MANEEQRKEGLNRNIWLDGIMGVVTGDALGCPVQFKKREELDRDPVTGMRGYGTYNMPAGTWTDDSSMTLATLDSILERGKLNFPDIMYRFALWLAKGKYTPFGEAFDVGDVTMDAIARYMRMEEPDIDKCGGISPEDNGNGSLMRIMPACLYLYQRYHLQEDDMTAVWAIHKVSGLTHNHLRAKMACGLYYFMVCEILDAKKKSDAGNRTEEAIDSRLEYILEKGMNDAWSFYSHCIGGDRRGRDQASGAFYRSELYHYHQEWRRVDAHTTPRDAVRSDGYVVDTLNAAVWCLVTTGSYRECALKAVNLGHDTDTIAAIAGGLAGLWYGYDSIPKEWLEVIQRRKWIEDMCRRAEKLFCSSSGDIMDSENENLERE